MQCHSVPITTQNVCAPSSRTANSVTSVQSNCSSTVVVQSRESPVQCSATLLNCGFQVSIKLRFNYSLAVKLQLNCNLSKSSASNLNCSQFSALKTHCSLSIDELESETQIPVQAGCKGRLENIDPRPLSKPARFAVRDNVTWPSPCQGSALGLSRSSFVLGPLRRTSRLSATTTILF
jgi:hypothetical protein